MKTLLPIARGRVSHTLMEDVVALIRASVADLDHPKTVERCEEAFANYTNRAHCVVFPFARTAIYAVMGAIKLQPGDKVLLPPVTIKAILDVVLHLELEPVFVDINPATMSFDSEGLAQALQRKPKVAILTYLFGLVPDLDDLVSQLRNAGVFIIEDFSQCLNGTFRGEKIGTFGEVSVYSSSSIKTFDTFGGGFAVTDDEGLAERLKSTQAGLKTPRRQELLTKILTSLVRNFVTQRWVFALLTWPMLSLLRLLKVPSSRRFLGKRPEEPLKALPELWFRKFTAFQAKFALDQLPQVIKKDTRRVELVRKLDSQHSYTNLPESHPLSCPVHWQHVVYADEPTLFIEFMAGRGIDCTTTSLVQISNLMAYPYQSETPNGERLFRNGVYLPCYHQLTDLELARVSKALDEMVKR